MLYHYTQLNRINKILKSQRMSFRLYDSRWMNDPSESKVFQEYVIKYQDNIMAQISSNYREVFKDALATSQKFHPSVVLPKLIYVLSFSTIPDSNIFWGSKYAGLNGISIGVNETKLIDNSTKKLGHNYIGEVYYFNSIEGEPNEKDLNHVSSQIDKMIEDVMNDISKIGEENLRYVIWENIISRLSIFHKHPSWSHEKEKRFVIIRNSQSNFVGFDKKIGVHYLPSGFGHGGLNMFGDEVYIDFDNNFYPRPFIEIELNKNTIEHLTLGPNFTEVDIEAVRNYLYWIDSEIEVTISGAQIR